MEDSAISDNKGTRFRNPWVLNFQKLGLELKCPLCLNLLNRPVLLPCTHVFCLSCIPSSTQFGADCPVCKAQFIDRDLRHLPFMENMATIYKCLDATFSTNLIQHAHSDSGRISFQKPALTNIQFDEKLNKELLENCLGDNSLIGQSINKRVGVEKNGNVDNGSVPIDARGIGFSSSGNPNSLSVYRTIVEMDVNPEAQSGPDSPPSFGDARGSDNDSSLRCSEHSSENSLVKRPRRENGSSKMGKLRNKSPGFGKDSNSREVKRHKQLNYGQGQLDVGKNDHIQAEEVSHSGFLMPNSELELQKVSEPINMQAPKTSDDLFVNKIVCAFCHSSKISEETGSMLHYSNGKLVVGHEATLSTVIHVHKLCIDWAPQVFYNDDKVQNLKAEVARGAKLKCSKCGEKGAALGCYVRSCRRSYHVPCAMGISKCRWDYEEYLMLCPAHSSVRFPKEKSKSGKNVSNRHAMPAIVSCQLSNLVASPDGEKKWVLCGSALSTEEKSLLVKFGKINDAIVFNFWNPNVTHVIAATDENGACRRTLKVLMAILKGRWIIKVDWIKACIEAKCHVDEEPFEVCLDNYGCRDGPKLGRLRALNNGPKLFGGLNIYFVGDFLPIYKEDLEDLVLAAGGTVIKSRDELSSQSCGELVAPTPRALVVYNLDPPEGCKLGEEVSILWKRLSEAEDVASKTRSKVIGHTWLLESIAAYKLQSFVC